MCTTDQKEKNNILFSEYLESDYIRSNIIIETNKQNPDFSRSLSLIKEFKISINKLSQVKSSNDGCFNEYCFNAEIEIIELLNHCSLSIANNILKKISNIENVKHCFFLELYNDLLFLQESTSKIENLCKAVSLYKKLKDLKEIKNQLQNDYLEKINKIKTDIKEKTVQLFKIANLELINFITIEKEKINNDTSLKDILFILDNIEKKEQEVIDINKKYKDIRNTIFDLFFLDQQTVYDEYFFNYCLNAKEKVIGLLIKCNSIAHSIVFEYIKNIDSLEDQTYKNIFNALIAFKEIQERIQYLIYNLFLNIKNKEESIKLDEKLYDLHKHELDITNKYREAIEKRIIDSLKINQKNLANFVLQKTLELENETCLTNIENILTAIKRQEIKIENEYKRNESIINQILHLLSIDSKKIYKKYSSTLYSPFYILKKDLGIKKDFNDIKEEESMFLSMSFQLNEDEDEDDLIDQLPFFKIEE